MTSLQIKTGVVSFCCVPFLVVLGCSGSSDGRVTVYPVSGRVLVGGEPAAGARVVLYPVSQELKGSGMPTPAATTDDDGEFNLRSFGPEDGAPEGEYKVTVVWPEVIPPNVNREMYQPRDRLKGRYADSRSTPLTASVPRGGGEIPDLALQ
jgi:hypothetical protein